MANDVTTAAKATVSPKVVAAGGAGLVLALIVALLKWIWGVEINTDTYATLTAVVVALAGYMTPDKLREIGSEVRDSVSTDAATRRDGYAEMAKTIEQLQSEVQKQQLAVQQANARITQAQAESPAQSTPDEEDYTEPEPEGEAEAGPTPGDNLPDEVDEATGDETTAPAEDDEDEAAAGDETTAPSDEDEVPPTAEQPYATSPKHVEYLRRDDGSIAGVLVGGKQFLAIGTEAQ